MFTDKRSKRVVFVAHCVLNQNAKIDRCAHYPGAMREVAVCLLDSGAGIVQMPCPELVCLGLDRQAEAGSVEEEDTRVARRMREGTARAVCARLAGEVSQQVGEYAKHGFKVAGILGINGSPTCGVETNWHEGKEAPGPGVFIEAIGQRLRLPVRGVKATDPEAAVLAAKELVDA